MRDCDLVSIIFQIDSCTQDCYSAIEFRLVLIILNCHMRQAIPEWVDYDSFEGHLLPFLSTIAPENIVSNRAMQIRLRRDPGDNTCHTLSHIFHSQKVL